MKLYLSLIGLIASLGLALADLTEEGSKVRQAQSDEVKNCKKVGQGTATTRSKRVFFKRRSGNVQEELIGLARNEAAKLGANAVVPNEISEDGKMRWHGYRCD